MCLMEHMFKTRSLLVINFTCSHIFSSFHVVIQSHGWHSFLVWELGVYVLSSPVVGELHRRAFQPRGTWCLLPRPPQPLGIDSLLSPLPGKGTDCEIGSCWKAAAATVSCLRRVQRTAVLTPYTPCPWHWWGSLCQGWNCPTALGGLSTPCTLFLLLPHSFSLSTNVIPVHGLGLLLLLVVSCALSNLESTWQQAWD